MRFFDLHCDTLTGCARTGTSLLQNAGQLDVMRGRDFSAWAQCFAVFVPDRLRGEEAYRFFVNAADYLHAEAEKGEKLHICRTMRQVKETTAPGHCSAILTVESAAPLAGKLEHLYDLAQAGVQMMTLTWNGANEVGDGIGVENAKGLTEFGKEVVEKMPDLGIRIDISHASEALFYDVAAHTSAALVASHSNAKKICGHRRNLTDEQFLEIVRRGGLVGLNFFRDFLHDVPTQARAEDVFRHAEHFLSLGGENVVAMGSDFDGAEMPEDLASIAHMEGLYELFLRHNYSEELVDRLFYENAYRFFAGTEVGKECPKQ